MGGSRGMGRRRRRGGVGGGRGPGDGTGEEGLAAVEEAALLLGGADAAGPDATLFFAPEEGVADVGIGGGEVAEGGEARGDAGGGGKAV